MQPSPWSTIRSPQELNVNISFLLGVGWGGGLKIKKGWVLKMLHFSLHLSPAISTPFPLIRVSGPCWVLTSLGSLSSGLTGHQRTLLKSQLGSNPPWTSASMQSPLQGRGGMMTRRRCTCAASMNKQACEGLRALDKCVQAVCRVAEGRRGWEAAAHTKSNWLGVKESYLSLQLHPNDDSMAGNKQRWVCRKGGGDDRKTRS